MGGGFTKASDANVRHIAKWNTVTKTWSDVGGGVSGSVYALASNGGAVYVGGTIGAAGDIEAGQYIEASKIAKWNPVKSCWSSLGKGLASPAGVSGMYSPVYSILVRENEVYVGGRFDRADGKPSYHFGIWHEGTGKHAPAFSNIPDVTFPEDKRARIELYQFVTDTEHSLQGLDFKAKVINLRPQTNPNDLQIRLEKIFPGAVSRYVYATFNSAKDASGVYKVIFTVTDACGASASDTIRVTVKPKNDPPVIETLPEITFNENDSLLFPVSNWFDYVSDAEAPDSILFFRIFSSENIKALRRDKSFLFTATPNWSGTSKLKVRVKDRRQNADTTWLTVNVKSASPVKPASLAKSSEPIPNEFILLQNYPNPFNPSTLIRFGLPQDAEVRIEILNLSGQHVATLLNGRKAAGYHEVLFEANSLASGVYFYRLTAGNFSAMKKLMLMR